MIFVDIFFCKAHGMMELFHHSNWGEAPKFQSIVFYLFNTAGPSGGGTSGDG